MADMDARLRGSRAWVVKAWKKIVDIAGWAEETGVGDGADIPVDVFPMGRLFPERRSDAWGRGVC